MLAMSRTAEEGLAQWVLPFNRKNLYYEVSCVAAAGANEQVRFLGGTSYNKIQQEGTSQIVRFVHKVRPEAQEVHRQVGVSFPCVSGIVYARTVACVSLEEYARELTAVYTPGRETSGGGRLCTALLCEHARVAKDTRPLRLEGRCRGDCRRDCRIRDGHRPPARPLRSALRPSQELRRVLPRDWSCRA